MVGGAAIAAIGAVYQLSQAEAREFIPFVLLGILVAVGMLGVITVINLLRRVVAFRDSLIAMNVIKEFYVRQLRRTMPSIDRAFRWRLVTIPIGERNGSINFLNMYIVAFVSALCFGGAAALLFELTQAVMEGYDKALLNAAPEFIVGVLIFTAVLVAYVVYYVSKIQKHAERVLLQKIEAVIRRDDRD